MNRSSQSIPLWTGGFSWHRWDSLEVLSKERPSVVQIWLACHWSLASRCSVMAIRLHPLIEISIPIPMAFVTWKVEKDEALLRKIADWFLADYLDDQNSSRQGEDSPSPSPPLLPYPPNPNLMNTASAFPPAMRPQSKPVGLNGSEWSNSSFRRLNFTLGSTIIVVGVVIGSWCIRSESMWVITTDVQ